MAAAQTPLWKLTVLRFFIGRPETLHLRSFFYFTGFPRRRISFVILFHSLQSTITSLRQTSLDLASLSSQNTMYTHLLISPKLLGCSLISFLSQNLRCSYSITARQRGSGWLLIDREAWQPLSPKMEMRTMKDWPVSGIHLENIGQQIAKRIEKLSVMQYSLSRPLSGNMRTDLQIQPLSPPKHTT